MDDDPSRTLLSNYFLRRLGLTSDELYWPATSEDAARSIITIDPSPDVQESWRVRDAVKDILKDNGVVAPTYTTMGEGGGGIKGEVVTISSVVDHLMPNDADIAKLRMLTLDGVRVDTGGKLNLEHAYMAFNAAAYSILRANSRVNSSKQPTVQEELQQLYEPPVIQAMESIRTSRIQSLNEAAGKSTPSFLKKNNTIPWFHVPLEQKKQPDAVTSSVKLAAKQAAANKRAVEQAKAEAEKVKMEAKKEEKKAAKRPAPENKGTVVKKMKVDNKAENLKAKTKVVSKDGASPKPKSSPVRLSKQPAVSRAILCAAAAVVFQKCTPDYDVKESDSVEVGSGKIRDWEIDPTVMPRTIIEMEVARCAASKKKTHLDISVETAMARASTMGNNALHKILGAARRNDRRNAFRLYISRSKLSNGWMRSGEVIVAPGHSLPLVIPNPFMEDGKSFTDSEAMDTDDESLTVGPLRRTADDKEWTQGCLPRLLSVLGTGAGHAIMVDMQWNDRMLRVAELLQNMTSASDPMQDIMNYGPHLLVTTSQDIHKFAKMFGRLGHDLRIVRNESDASSTNAVATLRALTYHGSREKRRSLRKHFGSLAPSPDSPYCFLGGQADSPYHIILTTYSAFAEDYVHFCQIPFQSVILDDGVSWLGSAHAEPDTQIGKVWNTALWSTLDHGAGMAGVSNGLSLPWDFSQDDGGLEKDKASKSSKPTLARKDSNPNPQVEKTKRGKLLIGLTARHRILVAPVMHTTFHGQLYKAPVSSLISFVAPNFIDTVRDDWDKSKLLQCDRSMIYLKKLIARSIVVYTGSSSMPSQQDLFQLAVKSLNGELTSSALPKFPHGSSPEAKTSLQRKDAPVWFRPGSAVLQELNDSPLNSILGIIKKYSLGFVCDEILPASTLTPSGANGAVTGPNAYRMGARCGRQFSNEASLRQHILACHAPAGTWLCRTCGIDCVTSPFKSHHEKTCLPADKTEEFIVSVAASAPTNDHRRGPKRKEIKGLAAATVKRDGSTKEKGYNGVWRKPNGKYFIKIDGEVIEHEEQGEDKKEKPILFDSAEEAAKQHDQILKDTGKAQVSEMNYKPDGSRIIHSTESGPRSSKDEEKEATQNAIVPALANVNLKNLPKHIRPLLRDPSWTSRTGGNSKRYVYAYRGVCRQARKGHDRWQAQISFNGFNHYLGTFDSEWDAAAIYAWAHLILYGEEATKKAQQEGEEAAAAWEQLQKDVAEGRLPPSALTSPKKVKRSPAGVKRNPGAPKGPRGPRKPVAASTPSESKVDIKKVEVKKEEHVKTDPAQVPQIHVVKELAPQKAIEPQPTGEKESSYTSMYSKKEIPKTVIQWNKLKTSCAMMLSSGTKGTSKANLLASRKQVASMGNTALLDNVSERLVAGSTSFLKSIVSFGESFKSMPTNIALTSFAPATVPSNGALLIGLSAFKFCWSIEDFMAKCHNLGASYDMSAVGQLTKEFGRAGLNATFRSLLLSTPCVIGKATTESLSPYKAVGIKHTMGMSVGGVGCDIGGPSNSCSDTAARIEFLPTKYGKFQISACNDKDIVTLNGRRIQSSNGAYPLANNDIVSVGARVFVFIQAYTNSGQSTQKEEI